MISKIIVICFEDYDEYIKNATLFYTSVLNVIVPIGEWEKNPRL